MTNYKDHLIINTSSIKDALIKLDILAQDAILFIIDDLGKLLGSLTDGDIRRGLLNGEAIDEPVTKVSNNNPKFILKSDYSIHKIIDLRNKNYRVFPLIDNDGVIINIINFRLHKSYLPLDGVIMAGGKGTRLRPLTIDVPKPLLKVGEKPIIEHNLDRLSLYGVDNYWISVNYLGEQIEEYFKNGKEKNINIDYVWEDKPLGTIGSLSMIKNFKNDNILLTNSDILTNLNYEHFFLDFISQDADLSVVTIPYSVDIPYAVIETLNNDIKSFKEKPTYTYYSNGGIYLMKKSVLKYLPEESFFNATDLMELLIEKGKKIISYPLSDYWLDIGKHEDYEKAQKDIKHIKF
jgi:dTDP-glucose pyrophosphorylase